MKKILFSLIILLFFVACEDYMNALKNALKSNENNAEGVCNENKTLCINEIEVTETTYSSFTISWKTNQSAVTYVAYREEGTEEFTDLDSQFAMDVTIFQTAKNLKSETKYYYKVVSKTNTETVETLAVPVTTEKEPEDTSLVCGNGTCDSGETALSCVADCGTSEYCGDGTCNNGETSSTCNQDCVSGDIPTDGLVAYYPFNGNQDEAIDESGNGNDGTVYGATKTSDRFGNENSAYSFDGLDDYIDLGLVSNDINSKTWSVWAKSNILGSSYPASSSILSNFDNGTGSGYPGLDIRINNIEDKIEIFGRYDNLYGILALETLNTTWHHYVAIYDGKLSVYIDNIHISESSNFDLLETIKNLLVGKETTSERYWDGKIDDIRIYNKALTETEIQALYQEGGWTGN